MDVTVSTVEEEEEAGVDQQRLGKRDQCRNKGDGKSSFLVDNRFIFYNDLSKISGRDTKKITFFAASIR